MFMYVKVYLLSVVHSNSFMLLEELSTSSIPACLLWQQGLNCVKWTGRISNTAGTKGFGGRGHNGINRKLGGYPPHFEPCLTVVKRSAQYIIIIIITNIWLAWRKSMLTSRARNKVKKVTWSIRLISGLNVRSQEQLSLEAAFERRQRWRWCDMWR